MDFTRADGVRASEPIGFPSEVLPLCVACQRLRRPVRGRWVPMDGPDDVLALMDTGAEGVIVQAS